MNKKDVLQIIVLKNGVEQFNVTNPKAAVLNVVEELPEEKKTKSNLLHYGAPQNMFSAQRDLEKETQKVLLRGILKGLDEMDDEERIERAEAAEARRD